MSSDRDPILEALFEESRPTVDEIEIDSAFIERVMAKVDNRRRFVTIGRLLIVALIFLLEFLPSSPLQNSVGRFTQLLGNELVNLDAGWMALIFAPVNSVAGIVGVLLIGLHVLYRRNVR